MIYIRST